MRDQEDAHEYFCFLVDSAHTELQKLAKQHASLLTAKGELLFNRTRWSDSASASWWTLSTPSCRSWPSSKPPFWQPTVRFKD